MTTLQDLSADAVLAEIARLARRHAIDIGTRRDVADDLAQEIALECLMKLRAGCSIDEIRAIVPRMRCLVRRRAIDWARRDRRREQRNAEHCREVSASTRAWMSPEVAAEERELSAIYSYVVDSLPPVRRRVFRMVREEEAVYDAVAERLGVSRNAVCAHVVKAQRKLRRGLEEMGIAPPRRGPARGRSANRRRSGGDQRTAT